jgi:arylsulfatase
MKSQGLVSCELSAPERDIGPPYDFPDAFEKLGAGEVNRPLPWKELTGQQREFQAAKMAVHAAMVYRMDVEIGRIIEQLRGMNALDNTLIFFLADNGASAEIMVRGNGHDQAAPAGSAATFLCLGPGWSTSSNTPFRRHKTWVHEGGISTPLIVHWPKGIAVRGELRHTPGDVIDLVPTILEAVGGKPLEKWEGADVPPLPGKSLIPALAKDVNLARDCLWWLHEGNRAIRVGDYKLVAAGAESPWELYDLSTDRAESQNLAEKMPGKARELAQLWQARFEEIRALATRDLKKNP